MNKLIEVNDDTFNSEVMNSELPVSCRLQRRLVRAVQAACAYPGSLGQGIQRQVQDC